MNAETSPGSSPGAARLSSVATAARILRALGKPIAQLAVTQLGRRAGRAKGPPHRAAARTRLDKSRGDVRSALGESAVLPRSSSESSP